MKWSTSNLPNRHTGAPKNAPSEVEQNANKAIALTPKAARPLPDPMGFNDAPDSPTVYSPAYPVPNWNAQVGDEFESETRWTKIKNPRVLTNENKRRRANVQERMRQNTLNLVAAGIRTPTRPTRPVGVPGTPQRRRSTNRRSRKNRKTQRRRQYKK